MGNIHLMNDRKLECVKHFVDYFACADSYKIVVFCVKCMKVNSLRQVFANLCDIHDKCWESRCEL